MYFLVKQVLVGAVWMSLPPGAVTELRKTGVGRASEKIKPESQCHLQEREGSQ